MVDVIRKYIDLRLLLVVASILFFIPVSIDTAQYCAGVAISSLPIPIWLSFISASLALGLAIYTIVIETKDFNVFGRVALILCSIIIISNIITTFLQPDTIVSHIYSFRLTYYVDITTNIDLAAKFLFVLHFAIIVSLLFISLFVAPKYVKTKVIIRYVAIACLILFLASIIYSLIFENSKYWPFISSIFTLSASPEVLSNNSLNSFYPHKNIYAISILVTLICSSYLFVESRKKYYCIIYVFGLLYMVLTYSKSFILLGWASSILFFYAYNLLTLKDNQKFKLILIIVFSSIVVALVTTAMILYSVNDNFKSMIDQLILGLGTFTTRKLLWKNVMQIITPSWIVTGRGFGIVETILPSVTEVSFVEVLPHEHSWFYSMLAKGGILLLIVFIIALLYICFISYKTFKKQKLLSLPLILGELVFFIQSFVENSYYTIFGIAFFLLIIQINDQEKVEKSEVLENENINKW